MGLKVYNCSVHFLSALVVFLSAVFMVLGRQVSDSEVAETLPWVSFGLGEETILRERDASEISHIALSIFQSIGIFCLLYSVGGVVHLSSLPRVNFVIIM